MAFERNDIVFDSRLMAALGSSEMGFDHNDIVTVDKMNAAIAAGGGGGGGDYKTANVTIVCDQEDGSFSLSVDQENSEYTGFFDKGDGAFNYEAFGNYGTPAVVKLLYSSDSGVYLIPYTTITSVTGDAVIDDGCALVTGDCTITGNSN